jgi:hypothetical protein
VQIIWKIIGGSEMSKSKTLLITLIALLTIPLFSYAAVCGISTWAEEEVTSAIEYELVPESLQMNYQTNITRSEYVLLALEVFNRKGEVIDTPNLYPFTDINNHKYRYEIVQAYNADLINGYEDHSFKPNDYISREEVATLMVNLISTIYEEDILLEGINVDYSDRDAVSDWAIPYVDYCYSEGLIKGTGKDESGLDIVDPHGQVTIEQAIILLYRLTDQCGLLNPYDLGTIQIVSTVDGQKIKTTSSVINSFAIWFSPEVATAIQRLSVLETIEVRAMSKDYAYLTDGEDEKNGSISLSKTGDSLGFYCSIYNLNNESVLNNYKEILKETTSIDDISQLIEKGLEEFSQNSKYSMNTTLEDGSYFSCSTYMIDSETIVYDFHYSKNLNK